MPSVQLRGLELHAWGTRLGNWTVSQLLLAELLWGSGSI